MVTLWCDFWWEFVSWILVNGGVVFVILELEKDKAKDKCVEGNVTAFSKDQILCFCLANAAYKICHVIVSDRLPCHCFGPTCAWVVWLRALIRVVTWSNGLVCGICFCTWGIDGGHDLGLVVKATVAYFWFGLGWVLSALALFQLQPKYLAHFSLIIKAMSLIG